MSEFCLLKLVMAKDGKRKNVNNERDGCKNSLTDCSIMSLEI